MSTSIVLLLDFDTLFFENVPFAAALNTSYSELFQTFNVSLNYTNLATLLMNVYAGKSKINSVKNVPPVSIEPKTSCNLPSYHTCCAEQTCVS